MGFADMGLLRDGTCWNGTVEMKMGTAHGWEVLKWMKMGAVDEWDLLTNRRCCCE